MDLAPLPFVVDPLDSLRPGGPNARREGNVWAAPQPPTPGQPPSPPALETVKWTAEDFANDEGEPGRLPMGKALEEWSFGDLEAGFTKADLVLDETFIVQSTGHHLMETRSAMAYWQNGKLYLRLDAERGVHVATIARWVGIEPSDVVLICEYTGGGFGSKGAAQCRCRFPLLSRKANAPVMMRISREELHRPRAHQHVRPRASGFHQGRSYHRAGSLHRAGLRRVWTDGRPSLCRAAASLIYQPGAMRWRAINVLTNTPPRTQQRSPGPMQANGIMEPIVTKAAKQLGLDQVAIRRINAPEGKAIYGPPGPNGMRPHATSAFVKEALDREARSSSGSLARRAAARAGPKVRGIGVAVGRMAPARRVRLDHDAASRRKALRAVGRRQPRAHSVFDLARAAADVLAMPWEKSRSSGATPASTCPGAAFPSAARRRTR